MNAPVQPPEAPKPPAVRAFIWRVGGVSLVFLLVGLAVIRLHFLLTERTTVGLETVDPLPPMLPVEQVAPNRVRLFFAADGAVLAPEVREVAPTESTSERAWSVVRALLKGPRSSALHATVPRGAEVRSLFVTEGSIIVDLSHHWRDALHKGPSAEMLCVYSLVNSVLLNCPDLKSMTLLIEGHPVELLRGYLDLSAPLVENLMLVAPGDYPGDSAP